MLVPPVNGICYCNAVLNHNHYEGCTPNSSSQAGLPQHVVPGLLRLRGLGFRDTATLEVWLSV